MIAVSSLPGAVHGLLEAEERRPPPARSAAEAARLAASALLHLGVLAALVLVGARSLPEPADVPALETEIISSRDFAALRAVPAPVVSPAPVPSSPSAEALPRAGGALPQAHASPAKSAAPEMICPARMLSEQALDSPRSRGLRRELARLGEEDRLAQICDLEAMEQIHAWRPDFQPDRLVDYASGDTALEGAVFTAKGGAFRSQRHWYEVSYRCALDPSLRKVVGFAFHVGAAIPREDWDSFNLPTLH
ncbi:DUF930 domain-containing protein [Ancylobacter sp. IITR112]|uniref:DUF930 domain-containing protein n=1 Tax=Ancylobacter sp. IITR112 TaxID=3138073 RepID=UPI00352B91E9